MAKNASEVMAQAVAVAAPTQALVPASLGLIGIDGNSITVRLDAGNGPGKLSSTGKSMVLVSDKVKFTRADGQEVIAQITCYMPAGK